MAEKQNNGANVLTEPVRRSPHNIDAERAVLGAILLDPEVLTDVSNIVKPEDFYAPAHKTIFEALRFLNDTTGVIELTLLVDHLRTQGKLDEVGGIQAVAALEQFVLSTGAAPEQAQKIAEKSLLRRLMLAAETIYRDCAEERRDVTQQLDTAQKLIFDIAEQSNRTDFRHIRELLDKALRDIEDRKASGTRVVGTTSGYPDLDKYLNGFHPTDLMILAARPSIGKTAFALNLMLNIACKANRPAAIFSLEMGAEQLNHRLLCCQAKVDAQKIARGFINDRELTHLHATAKELAEKSILIDDTPALTMMQVRSRARRLKRRYPDLGLLVIDYLQLMSASDRPSRDANRQQEVSDISRGLKALAKELEVPVLALSQLSRNIEQRTTKKDGHSAKPMLSDLRESGAIEQDADIVMFVHRERRNTDDPESTERPDAPIPTQIIIGKHRNGPIGDVDLLFMPSYGAFVSVAR